MQTYARDDLNEKYDKGEIVAIICQDALAEDSKQVKSQVWKQFHRLLDTVTNILLLNFVVCKICKTFVHFNGKTTTRLLAHQQNCPEQSKSGKNKRKPINFNPDDLLPLRNAAAKFVSFDFRPAYAVHGKGLCEYIYSCVQLSKLYPNMSFEDLLRAMPSRNLVTSHIQNMASDTVVMLKKMLRDAIMEYGCIGVTSDLWTDKMNSTPFITITVHFFVLTTVDLQLKSIVLELCKMAFDRMTGANIRQAIVDIFAPFDITEAILCENTCFVTDRGANMLLAVKDFESHACLAHLLNSVVGEMLAVAGVKNVLNNASALVRYLKLSHVGSQLSSKVKAHVDTRWNTAYDMLMSIIENYNELFHLLQAKDETAGTTVLDRLTCLSLTEMKAICELLAFFKSVTSSVEGEKFVTIHTYWPALLEMKRTLATNRCDHEYVKAMKKAGLDYIEKLENSGSLKVSIRHKIAVFLHPQMKSLAFASTDDKKEIHAHIKDIIAITRASSLHESANEPPTASTSAVSLFQSYFDNNNENDDDSEFERYVVIKVKVAKNFHRNEVFRNKYSFFSKFQAQKDKKFDLLDWWFSHRKIFPALFTLFMRNCCVPASSASSERAFSLAGNVMTARRNRLSADHLRDISRVRVLIENKQNEM